MAQNDIKILLEKFSRNACSNEEIEMVIQYFRENELTDDFPEVSTSLPGESLSASSADRIFSNILSDAEQQNQSSRVIPLYRRRGFRWASVAAVFLVLLGSGWLMTQRVIAPADASVQIDPNAITLQTADGEIMVINADGSRVLTDKSGKVIANQENGKLVYGTSADASGMAYNTLRIPYGKRFALQLADGSTVHLNAGTSLKYPVEFKGERREVFLEGEAFFEVAKDKAHPFIVNAGDINIGVLGTKFNVSNYEEDDRAEAVLTEGSVSMFTKSQTFDPVSNKKLVPGEKGSFDRKSGNLTSKKVLTDAYTAWVKGELYFHDMTFAQICKKLERRYDIVIENRDPELAKQRFNASFREEPLAKIMSYFNEIKPIHYKITQNRLIIEKPKS